MTKVKCKVCSHFNGFRCTEKNTKVNGSKPRKCTEFIYDPEKVVIKQKLKAVYVPYHMTSRKAYKKHLAEQELQTTTQESLENKLENLKNPDILSKFRSSAS